MSLYGAVAGPTPGKKIVTGSESITAGGAVDLSGVLATVDAVYVSYRTAQAATNAYCWVLVTAPDTVVFSCLNSAFGAATTAATIDYLAVGDAPK